MVRPNDHLAALLRDNPDAWVGAISPNALYVPIPASVPVAGHRQLQGKWALDHVAVGHREPLSAAWREAMEHGHASVRVLLVSGGHAIFHAFKVADEHGVDVVVALADDSGNLAVAPTDADILTTSRFSRILRDDTGRAIEIDGAAPEVLGWSSDALLSRTPPLERVHPDDRHLMLEGWMSTLADPATGHRARARLLRSDGSYRWFEITNFNRLDDPSRPCVITEFLDITEEMAAHESVRASERLLRRLAESLPLGVLQLDRDRVVVYKNEYLAEIIGKASATTMDEQFQGTVAEDLSMLERAFDAALVEGADDEVVVRMLRRGTRSERLIRVITKSLADESGEVAGVIACISDVTETELLGRDLERRATFDALTGCLNRAAALARLDALVSTGDAGCAVIFLDLDDLKTVNDRSGHAVGDELLRAAARVLESTTRADDAIGRFGGDEFLVVCGDVSTADDALELARRVSEGFSRHPIVLGAHVPLRASIGVAWARAGSTSAERLLENADAAMYAAKRAATAEPQLYGAAERSPRSA